MEKQKRWQFVLIVLVMALTIYNILPTVFYYSKPLKEEISEARAEHISESIAKRVNSLQKDSQDWLYAFCQLLQIHPTSIRLNADYNEWFEVHFKDEVEARTFKTYLPNAGSLIPFVPAQLTLGPQINPDPKVVIVERQIGARFNKEEIKNLFKFSKKQTQEQAVSPLYRSVIDDRAQNLLLSIAGPSDTAKQVAFLVENKEDKSYDDAVIHLASELLSTQKAFAQHKEISDRFFASFFQGESENTTSLISAFTARLDTAKMRLATQKAALNQSATSDQNKDAFSGVNADQIKALTTQIAMIEDATKLLKEKTAVFASAKKPLTLALISEKLKKSAETATSYETIDITGYHPMIQSLVIDWSSEKILFKFYTDLQTLRSEESKGEAQTYVKDQIEQIVINAMARIARTNDEAVRPEDKEFSINLNSLSNSSSFLAFDLGEFGNVKAEHLKGMLQSAWQPTHPDLQTKNYPVYNYNTFKTLPSQEQKLALVVYAPQSNEKAIPEGFNKGSIYVIARNLEPILKKYQDFKEAEETQNLIKDVTTLSKILQNQGFIQYSGKSYGMDKSFKNDLIFELRDYYSVLLKATRENFSVHGSKQYAILEFTDVEQRILTENRIDDAIHENLLQWKENYAKAHVSMNNSIFTVPKPTKNILWENIKLTAVKYFRGDDRNILRWGLDLSGGKSVRIGLRDKNNQVITAPEEINQAVNELYTRINKMGVSEKNIRVENANIILEFPGSQGLSASELVKASSMTFQIINEKFSIESPVLGSSVNAFLQEVWNEAVVTNRKDLDSIALIAWEHLGGEEGSLRPKTVAAQTLSNAGLVLAHPSHNTRSNAFDDTISAINSFRGDDHREWHGQSHPLLITFNNYALEGSSLSGIQVGHSTSEGNYLAFSVRGSYDKQSGNPRNDFHRWTSEFARDRIAGTLREQYAPKDGQGRITGWRMAIILNNEVVSSPQLSSALREGGQISGRFTQLEINKLAADLKAGSLSFTPKILSEYNISPDLGKEERTNGIRAAIIGAILVVVMMVGYYGFAGAVASFALIFNILIMWGILQNLGAALSLPGIAGFVLTIGIAVDANVRVFERAREEFKISHKISSALQAGYSKAFTAIVDSNITTIIAALILIQFDSGPIKGFATTLIIGIVASMFTSLFMTRFFFAGWVKNPKNKMLHMREFIEGTKFDFLKMAKPAIMISLTLIAVGAFFFAKQKATIFGMDFTGGYALVANLEEKPDTDYRKSASEALLKSGLSTQDFQIQELTRPNQLRLQFGTNMEQEGRPFYQMPQETTNAVVKYAYENNPRLVWVINALETHNVQIQPWQLDSINNNWSAMSGQLSDAMRNNALIALGCALLSILVYITIRFEFKYAAAAVIGLIHDVIITLGALAIFKQCGFPVQIDLTVIGAIMTIIGYSLNDTIIIFDRVREDLHIMKKKPMREIMNHALNITLSRTLLTSGTTLVVLLSLVLFGGYSIFTFSLTMTIGVLVGTLSSLLIAAPVMLLIHDYEEKKEDKPLHLKHS